MYSFRFSSWLIAVVCCTTIVRGEDRLRGTIDRRVEASWKENEIKPAKPSTDAEFLRRVYLDLLGTIPTFEEASAFLDDQTAGKRPKLIDRLLDDPRFAGHQAEVWDQVLFGRNPPRRVKKLCAVKVGDLLWVQFPPGDGSLQPEAIEAAEEVTNSSKPSM